MISVNLSIELDGRQNSFKTNILQGYRMKMNQSIKLKGEAPKNPFTFAASSWHIYLAVLLAALYDDCSPYAAQSYRLIRILHWNTLWRQTTIQPVPVNSSILQSIMHNVPSPIISLFIHSTLSQKLSELCHEKGKTLQTTNNTSWHHHHRAALSSPFHFRVYCNCHCLSRSLYSEVRKSHSKGG